MSVGLFHTDTLFHTLWFVGRPRRKSSLSIAGRSSWINDMVWTISMAHAVGMAAEISPECGNCFMNPSSRSNNCQLAGHNLFQFVDQEPPQ